MRTDWQPEKRGTSVRSWIRDVPAEDRAVVKFATFELFVIIYLEKFALGPPKFQLTFPLLFMSGGVAWMIMTGRISFSKTRLGLYFIFVSCCLFSALTSNAIGSVPSMMELFLLYSFMTASAPLSEAGYQRVLDNFMKLMIVPAIIVLFQFFVQRIIGQKDPINMFAVMPKSIMVSGYVYNAPFPNWDSPFSRPNGFFFLEPSFASFFTAAALIIEIMFFRRVFFVILMTVSTALIQGGTGVVLLVLASPFLLANESPRVTLTLGLVAIAGLLVAYMLGANLPLVSRLDELNTQTVGGGYNSSGALRIIIPWTRLVEVLSDPAYLLTGTGAGSTSVQEGSPWPILKITLEYGVITMISFAVFVSSAFVGKRSVPLRFAAWVVFNFTGGYLLDSVLISTFSLIFCIIEPVQSKVVEMDLEFPRQEAPAGAALNRRGALGAGRAIVSAQDRSF